ncbi:hypothetical protein, partial [Enterobacter cloacae complex sp. CH23B]|uniref:hypothetical protein n=1 Tax=Enterobacter cloacae complex sp. CH23B TaxID=2511986 RepID=UPI001CA51C5E
KAQENVTRRGAPAQVRMKLLLGKKKLPLASLGSIWICKHSKGFLRFHSESSTFAKSRSLPLSLSLSLSLSKQQRQEDIALNVGISKLPSNY